MFVAADDHPPCYPVLDCDVDPIGMKAAIELIPDPYSSSEASYPDAASYRVPALFEYNEDAQIIVRISAASGIVLDGEGLMEHLWPYAKAQALYLYRECNMDSSAGGGLSARESAILEWDGPPVQRLEFEVDMTCNIDKTRLGATIYTASGIQRGSGIGEGRNHTGLGGFGSGWVCSLIGMYPGLC